MYSPPAHKETHNLLEPPTPPYTNGTVRRAFIVWMYCGQRNQFRDVCNYYHQLEAMENKLPEKLRAFSRHHEFNLFSNQPPSSTFLKIYFPHLYCHTQVEHHYITRTEPKNENFEPKFKACNKNSSKNGLNKNVETSQIIMKFCRDHQKSLKKFFTEYKYHASKCELQKTVDNVELYVKRKMVQAELELIANIPKTFTFLDSSSTKSSVIDDVVCNQTKLLAGVTLKSKEEGSMEVNNNKVNGKSDVNVDLIDFSKPEGKFRAIKGRTHRNEVDAIDKEPFSLLDRDDVGIDFKNTDLFLSSNFVKKEMFKCI